jgi:hypothetical protein
MAEQAATKRAKHYRDTHSLSMYDGNATTTAKTNFRSNKLLRRRVVVYYPLHVYMN